MTPRKRVEMPASVKVGPLHYEVAADSLSHLLAEHGATKPLLGQCDHQALKIVLAPEQAPLALRSTALHEVLHAVIATAAFPIDTDDEERLVRVLEAPLFQLIRDNPALIAWLSD